MTLIVAPFADRRTGPPLPKLFSATPIPGPVRTTLTFELSVTFNGWPGGAAVGDAGGIGVAG